MIDGMIVLQLLACCLLPVGLSVIFYFLYKKTKFNLWPYKYKQLIIGIVFGGVAIFGTEVGVDVGGGVMANIRDSGPLVAGLIFGGPSGIIAGVIGGLHRVMYTYVEGKGAYTVLACSLSTFLAGVYAALLRKYMFDNKRPSWGFGLFIGIIMEVIHLTILFLTKLQDLDKTFSIIKTVAVPMILANGVATMLSCMILNIIANKENPIINRYKKLTNQIQFWLLITVLIVFVGSTSLVYVIQTNTSYNNANNLMELNLADVTNEVRDSTADDLLSLNAEIKEAVEADIDVPVSTLQDFAALYGVDEINICIKTWVPEAGQYKTLIYNSNIQRYVDNTFYMDDYDQPREFNILLPGSEGHVEAYVQPLRKNAEADELMKYAGMTLELPGGDPRVGYVQVGYTYERFSNVIDTRVHSLSANRHIGETGIIIVANRAHKVVSSDDEELNKVKLEEIGFDIDNKEVDKRYEKGGIYFGKYNEDNEPISEKGCYIFTTAEEYFIVAAMPTTEVLNSRDNVIYLTCFMEVLMFAVLFALVYQLIMKLVVNNIDKINKDLGKIIDGDLEVSLDVKGSDEFVSLSNDINTTVSTMKHYIEEAASRIDKELEFAKSIQTSSLPTAYPAFPNVPSIDIYAKMFTAKEVGGDFYDYYMLDANHIGFLVADVSGKGVPASLFMMQAKATIKNYASRCIKTNEVMELSNNELCKENDAGLFVTCWFGIMNTDTGWMYFCNAGHNPPVVYRAATKTWEYLKSSVGLVLAGFEGVPYPKEKLQLDPGDRVFLYTDGVTEATREDKVLYGEERLLKYLTKHGTEEIHQVLDGLKEDIDKFIDGAPQFDDITMLMLEYRGPNDIEVGKRKD